MKNIDIKSVIIGFNKWTVKVCVIGVIIALISWLVAVVWDLGPVPFRSSFLLDFNATTQEPPPTGR